MYFISRWLRGLSFLGHLQTRNSAAHVRGQSTGSPRLRWWCGNRLDLTSGSSGGIAALFFSSWASCVFSELTDEFLIMNPKNGKNFQGLDQWNRWKSPY